MHPDSDTLTDALEGATALAQEHPDTAPLVAAIREALGVSL